PIFHRSYSEWRDSGPPRTTDLSFPNLKTKLFFYLERRACANHQIRPVFRFYASLPRTPLLQGNRFNRGYVARAVFHFERLQGANLCS
ncbi:hypothetical protein ACQKKF_20570, partial [Pedobacter suwonensis]|uniref:hypothetical protein n=1 Tax=Pedobacter suwonensis TaxID=332999 RepID=UPI003D0416A4